MQSDPFSLDRLQDIVEPEPVSWWPPADVWWVVAALIGSWGIYAAASSIHHWIGNAYRRQALRELEALGRDSRWQTEVSTILKRVALVSFSREQVASLTGDAWLGFLNETCRRVDFTKDPVRCLGSASSDPSAPAVDESEFRRVLETARRWITDHEAEGRR